MQVKTIQANLLKAVYGGTYGRYMFTCDLYDNEFHVNWVDDCPENIDEAEVEIFNFIDDLGLEENEVFNFKNEEE